QRLGSTDQPILQPRGLLVLKHLLDSGLAHVDDREPLTMEGADFLRTQAIQRDKTGLTLHACRVHRRPPCPVRGFVPTGVRAGDSAARGEASDWPGVDPPTD